MPSGSSLRIRLFSIPRKTSDANSIGIIDMIIALAMRRRMRLFQTPHNGLARMAEENEFARFFAAHL
jgi:hypothetical protein